MQEELSQEERKSTPRKHRRGLTRIAAACERCRKRKQKCDNKLPTCGPCNAVGAKCILSDRLTVFPGPSNPDAEALRAEVSELQKQIHYLKRQLTARGGLGSSNTAIEIDQNREGQETGINSTASVVYANSQTQFPGQIRVGSRILRPTFSSEKNSRIDDGDKSSAWSLWKDDQNVETPSEDRMLTSIKTMDEYGPELIKTFFEQRWPHSPILHRPSFLRDHFQPLSMGFNVSGVSRFQVYMVFAIASLERGRTAAKHPLSHQEFFALAIRELNIVIAADDLVCVQCLLLMCMYGRTEPQSVNMWYTTGLAMRIAIGNDLHRADCLQKMDLFQAEMAKRIFWCVYNMDRSMSMYLGRPLGIQDSEITLPLPLQLTDEDIETQSIGTVIPRTKPDVKDMSTFIHVIKMRGITACIYKSFHSVGAQYQAGVNLEDERQNLYGQLNEWVVTAPRYPMTTSMFQSPEWFQIAYHHSILNLHRPSYAKPEPSINALQLCADSSISLISCYGSLYAKNKVSYSFVALHSIFMAMLTMLYALRASPAVRKDLTREVIEANINSCLALLRGIAGGREVAKRASRIIKNLGDGVLSLFDNDALSVSTSQDANSSKGVDSEFTSWFGLKSRVSTRAGNGTVADAGPGADVTWATDSLNYPAPLTTLDVDVAWEDLFAEGWGMDSSTNMNLFPHTGF